MFRRCWYTGAEPRAGQGWPQQPQTEAWALMVETFLALPHFLFTFYLRVSEKIITHEPWGCVTAICDAEKPLRHPRISHCPSLVIPVKMIQLWCWWLNRNNSMQSYCLTFFLSSSLFLYFWYFPNVFSSAHDFSFSFCISLTVSFIHIFFLYSQFHHLWSVNYNLVFCFLSQCINWNLFIF